MKELSNAPNVSLVMVGRSAAPPTPLLPPAPPPTPLAAPPPLLQAAADAASSPASASPSMRRENPRRRPEVVGPDAGLAEISAEFFMLAFSLFCPVADKELSS